MKLAFSFVSLVAFVGCGGPASVCSPVSCPLGGATYESCAQANGTVAYTLGASTCTCTAGDTAGCMQCAQAIANYCGDGVGGGGGSGGLGGGGSGGLGGGGSGGTGGGGSGGTGGGTSPIADCTAHSAGLTTSQFVFTNVLLPKERTDFAYDLTGSGRAVNQYGVIMGALEQLNLDPQASVDMEVQAGQEVILMSESSTDPSFQSDSCATATLVTGAPVSMPPTEGAIYQAAGTPGVFVGPLAAATFDSTSPAKTKTPVSLALPIPFLDATAPVNVPIVGAHLQFYNVGGTTMRGQLNGAVKQRDVDGVIIPAMAQALQGKLAADAGMLTSTDMSILSLFDTGGTPGATPSGCSGSCASSCQNAFSSDARSCLCAVAGDGFVDVCEVATNEIIQSIYAPDVQLFDANGNYAPNPAGTVKDSVSIGIGFAAIPAHF